MDGGSWWATVHGVAKSQTRLSDFTFFFSCLILCDRMDCSLPGSCVHRILQARNTGMGWHALLQGIFPTMGLNLGVSHGRQIPCHLSHQRTPRHTFPYISWCFEWLWCPRTFWSPNFPPPPPSSLRPPWALSSWTRPRADAPREGLLHQSDPATLTAAPQDPAVPAAEEVSPQAGAVAAAGTRTHPPERRGQLWGELSPLGGVGVGQELGAAVSSIISAPNTHTHTHTHPAYPLLPCGLLLFSCRVVSDSLWPHGLQHARLPCPSPSPGVCPSSCLSSRWCHSSISSSVFPFSSCLQSFTASWSLLMGQFFASGGQTRGASASASVFPVTIQGWFPLGLTALIWWLLVVKGLL